MIDSKTVNKTEQIDFLAAIANRLNGLAPANDEELALVGFAVGAIYSLQEATRISEDGYSDEHLDPEYPQTLMTQIASLSAGEEIADSPWLSGYFFNSGLYRIAALNERVDKYIGSRSDLAGDVHHEVNRLKHRVEGVIGGRNVGISEAQEGLEKLVESLATFMEKKAA